MSEMSTPVHPSVQSRRLALARFDADSTLWCRVAPWSTLNEGSYALVQSCTLVHASVQACTGSLVPVVEQTCIGLTIFSSIRTEASRRFGADLHRDSRPTAQGVLSGPESEHRNPWRQETWHGLYTANTETQDRNSARTQNTTRAGFLCTNTETRADTRAGFLCWVVYGL